MKGNRQIVLDLDQLDYDVIAKEIANYQASSAKIRAMSGGKGGAILPDGDSNLAGAIIAESIRSLVEYREMFDARNDEQR